MTEIDLIDFYTKEEEENICPIAISTATEEIELHLRHEKLRKEISKHFNVTKESIKGYDGWKTDVVKLDDLHPYDPIRDLIDTEEYYDSDTGELCTRSVAHCFCTTIIHYFFILSREDQTTKPMLIGSTCMTYFDNEKVRKEALAKMREIKRKKRAGCKKCKKELPNMRKAVCKEEGFCSDVCAGRPCSSKICNKGISKRNWSIRFVPLSGFFLSTDCNVKKLYMYELKSKWCDETCFNDYVYQFRLEHGWTHCKDCKQSFGDYRRLSGICTDCAIKRKEKEAAIRKEIEEEENMYKERELEEELIGKGYISCKMCKELFFPKFSNHRKCVTCWKDSIRKTCIDCSESFKPKIPSATRCLFCYIEHKRFEEMCDTD